MNRPRWHKILSDLWGNPARSLLVIASITVGLFAIGVITTLYIVIHEDMRSGYMEANPTNIQMGVSPFTQDLIDHIKDMEGLQNVEGLRIFNSRLEKFPGEWVTIDMNAADDLQDKQIDQVKLVSGKWPPEDREIVIEQYKFKEINSEIGEMVTIELPSQKKRQLKLVGVIADQTVGAFSIGPGFFLAPAQGYLTLDTLEWLEQPFPDTFNTLRITVSDKSDDEKYLQEISDQIRSEIERIGYTINSNAIRASDDHPNRIFVEAIGVVLIFLGLFVVFLSGFLITNTLQAIINQQIAQIGILKSLGARQQQIIILYVTLILIFGLMAVLISVPLAYQVSFLRIKPLVYTLNSSFQGARVIPTAIILQVIIALVAPLLAALVPIIQGARVSVQEALSGIRQSHNPTQGSFEKRLASIRRLPRPMLISIRNIFRRKGRLVLTLITLSLGGAIFIATFNVQVSMQKYVDQVSQYFLADVNLVLVVPQRVSEIKEALADVPGVSQVEGWAWARGNLVDDSGSIGENIQLLAPPAGSSLVEPVLIQGRWIESGDQDAIVLNERYLEDFPDTQLGDTIQLKLNGEDSTWTVVGFFQMAGKSSGYIAYTDYVSLSQLIHQSEKAVTYRILATQPDLTEEEQELLSQRIEAHLNEKGIRISDISTGGSLASNAAQGFAALTGLLLFLSSLTAIVGSIGLAGTMSINIMERTREIGIMRAIGATNPILLKLVIAEGLLIGLISWVLATLLAFPISKLLSDSVSYSLFGNPSTFEVTPIGFLLWIVVVLILSILASLLPAYNATRLTIREVLAYE